MVIAHSTANFHARFTSTVMPRTVAISIILLCTSLFCVFNDVAADSAKTDVIILTDTSFEHDTQASTGSTTGPWFVKFYAPWCTHCKSMAPAWEMLATKLKGKVNIAKVDTDQNPRVTKRFGITGFPTLLFFADNKMIAYNSSDRTLEKLVEFASGAYKNVSAVEVPKELSASDLVKDYVQNAAIKVQKVYIHATDAFYILVILSFVVGLILGFILCMLCGGRGSSGSQSSRKAKSKKKD